MNVNQLTSEHLVKTALHRSKIDQRAPEDLLRSVIADMDSETDPLLVEHSALVNSIRDGIERLKRITIKAEKDFETCRQRRLFGEEIPEHKVPRGKLHESAAEMDEWMRSRAEMERENAELLQAAADEKQLQADRYAAWSQAVHHVCEVVQAAGYDPAELSYAEALSKAETL